MELFQDVVRGPYAFLLILQILIVSGLMLTLIWLIVQRTREMANRQPVAEAITTTEQADLAKAAGAAAASASAPAPAAAGEALGEPMLGEPVLDGAVTGFGDASNKEAAPLSAQSTTAPAAAAAGSGTEAVPHASNSMAEDVLAEKLQEMKTLSEEGLALKDKIKYLESRLMEYEIVQEEISNLSQLRVENERLKEELLQFQGSRRSADDLVAATAPEAPAAAPAPGGPAEQANPVLDSVSQNQIDTILKKLDQITTDKP